MPELTISGDYGDFKTVAEFYDCECDDNYIKHKQTNPTCDKCGASHDEAPDSRLNEVLELEIDDEFEPCVRCGGGYDEMYFIDCDPVCADCITEKEKREAGYNDE